MSQRASVGFCALLLATFSISASSVQNCNACASNERCVGNPNVQAVEDDHCEPCASGQTWWPCDVENLCYCWDPATPRVPPPPSSGLDFAAAEPCDLLTEEKFNAVTGGEHQAPYTYAGLCAAIEDYNRLHPTEHAFKMGTLEQQTAEIVAFLGNTLHESASFKAPREYLPCGDFKVVDGKTYCKPCSHADFNWATKQCSSSQVAGGAAFTSYCDSARSPPGACTCGPVTQASDSGELAGYIEADKAFFGRGAIQLSWNYLYIRASAALTGDPDTFCANPDLVATVEKYAWGAGIFFWMENMRTTQGSNGELSTCHIQALSGDMGSTLWIINGNQECPPSGEWHAKAVVMRINHYCRAANVMGVASLLSFAGCSGMSEAFANCDPAKTVEEGGCPDCAAWKGISTTTATSTSTTATVLDTTTSTTNTETTSSRAASTTTTSNGIDTSTVTTTLTGKLQCVDEALPIAWSGGGVHTCSTYEGLGGLAYCSHAELQSACCFCGGGQQEVTSTSTTSPTSTTSASLTTALTTTAPQSTTSTTSASLTTTSASVCTDAPLPIAWSGGGVHTCATYEQHGGLAYCAHRELADACCFCRTGRRLRAVSSQGGAMPSGVALIL